MIVYALFISRLNILEGNSDDCLVDIFDSEEKAIDYINNDGRKFTYNSETNEYEGEMYGDGDIISYYIDKREVK